LETAIPAQLPAIELAVAARNPRQVAFAMLAQNEGLRKFHPGLPAYQLTNGRHRLKQAHLVRFAKTREHFAYLFTRRAVERFIYFAPVLGQLQAFGAAVGGGGHLL